MFWASRDEAGFLVAVCSPADEGPGQFATTGSSAGRFRSGHWVLADSALPELW